MRTLSYPAALAAGLAVTMVAPAIGSTWTGADGSWSSNANPGWNTTGVPNSIGAIATKTDNTSATITQNVSGGVTIGEFSLSGTNAAPTFTAAATSNAITFNMDSGGAGVAFIRNSTTHASNATRVAISGTVTLADDLRISNTSNSQNVSAISLSANIGGSGNVTISNNSLSTTLSRVTLTDSNSFTGNVLVEKGYVFYNTGTALGNANNVVTLGSAGNSTTLNNNSNNTTANDFIVAATTGTTILSCDTTSSATNTIFSGDILLDGNLRVSSSKTGTADVRLTGAISGVGGLSPIGTGKVQLGDGTTNITNTYAGNTTVSGTGAFELSNNAQLTFAIGNNGVSNKLSRTASQAVALNGDFVFDLTAAASEGTWKVVDLSSYTGVFGSTFTVVGFTEVANVWTLIDGPKTYTFSELTGELTAVPEPASFAAMGLLAMGTVRRRKR